MTKWTETAAPTRTTVLVIDGAEIEVSFERYEGDPDPENNDPAGWVLEMVKVGSGWMWAGDALAPDLVADLQTALTAAYHDSLCDFGFDGPDGDDDMPPLFSVTNERGLVVVA